MTTDSAPPTGVTLGYYAVGFFDLLGQQDYLRAMKNLPTPGDTDAFAKLGDDLKNTHGAVKMMRQLFAKFFELYTPKPPDDPSLTLEERAVFAKMISHPIQFQGFSDSMLAFMSVHDADEARLPTQGILGIFTSAGVTFLGSMLNGHPIRGGIDIGIGFEPEAGEIYGPALSRAYALESKIAQYPRVVVGEELVKWLTELGRQDVTDIFSRTSQNTANECLSCLTYDTDGVAIIDYLGPYFASLAAKAELDASPIHGAYETVKKFAARYKEEKNSQLAFRYASLRRYFEARMPLWQDHHGPKAES
jgi:hypothetical protein